MSLLMHYVTCTRSYYSLLLFEDIRNNPDFNEFSKCTIKKIKIKIEKNIYSRVYVVQFKVYVNECEDERT